MITMPTVWIWQVRLALLTYMSPAADSHAALASRDHQGRHIAHLEVACASVILDEVVLVQDNSSTVCQIHSPLKQVPVSVQGGQGDAIQLWIAHHAYIQVAITQPCGCVTDVLDCAQHNLCIEVVWNGLNELRLNGQLHVEEG